MATEFIGIVVGDSAYEIAVKDGFTGTQAEWLASLKGPAGVGEDGKAATVEVGTVSTLPAGSQATVENVGTTVDAVLNFAIPQGAKGADGSGSGGGIAEAPEDGKQYARQDATWVEVEASGTYDDTGIKADITSLQNNKADKTEIPDVSSFVTDDELQSMNESLTASIATKQPTGEYALKSDIPTVPTTLPNPNALTINGTQYDGSEAVTLTVGNGGGEGGASLATDEEWNVGIATDKAPTVQQVANNVFTDTYRWETPVLTGAETPFATNYAVRASQTYSSSYAAHNATLGFDSTSGNGWRGTATALPIAFEIFFNIYRKVYGLKIKNEDYLNSAITNYSVSYSTDNYAVQTSIITNATNTITEPNAIWDITFEEPVTCSCIKLIINANAGYEAVGISRIKPIVGVTDDVPKTIIDLAVQNYYDILDLKAKVLSST